MARKEFSVQVAADRAADVLPRVIHIDSAKLELFPGGRTKHALGFRQLVAERFPGLAGGGAVGRAVRAVLRRAIGCVLRGRRRGLLRRRRRGGWGLRDRCAGGCHHETRKDDVRCGAHEGKRAGHGRCSRRSEM